MEDEKLIFALSQGPGHNMRTAGWLMAPRKIA
jgi:hypothetical protein